jgi:hypothetical protein
MTTDNSPPRFVPTLTEVVDDRMKTPAQAPGGNQPVMLDLSQALSEFPAGAPRAPAADAPLPPITAEMVASTLLRRIGPELDRQIAETIARVLHDQMLGFNGRLQKAVAEVVHEAVVRGMTGVGAPAKGSNS